MRIPEGATLTEKFEMVGSARIPQTLAEAAWDLFNQVYRTTAGTKKAKSAAATATRAAFYAEHSNR